VCVRACVRACVFPKTKLTNGNYYLAIRSNMFDSHER